MKGILYLLPNSLGDSNDARYLPPDVKKQIIVIKHLIVENIRNARRYLKSLDPEVIIDDIQFYELNKHTDPKDIDTFLDPARKGNDVGVLSEAGLPGIADPGAVVAGIAHKSGIRVIPLTGPSSIFLALMASGMNGQSFRFLGYLPVKSHNRIKELKNLEQLAVKRNESQVFIETPYRNMQMLDDILGTCHESTSLTIAADITLDSEFIKTASIGIWKKKKPELHKRPVVFIIGK